MTKPIPPVAPPPEESIERPPHELVPPRPVRNGLLALACALVWPVLLFGIGWSTGLLVPTSWDDLVLVFGGLSVVLLIPFLMALPQQGELLAMVFIPLIWLAVVVLLPWLLRRRLGKKTYLFLLLLGISLFSLFQALLGLVMIATKNV